MFDPSRWDVQALAASWRTAQPFGWVAIDGLVGEAALAELRAALSAEPHVPNRGELFEMMVLATPEPTQPALCRLLETLGSDATRAVLGEITGKSLARVDGNTYVYLAGSYLLPHTDHRPGVDRRLAYVYYLSDDDAFTGGELDLYRCTVDAGEIAATEVATTLAPRKDRLLLFDVGQATVHQVREIRSGARASLAGWFY